MAITIPSVTYNSQFGNISKCIWFESVDNYNDFTIDISVERSQLKDTNLVLINLGTGQQKWAQIFPKSPITEPYLVSPRILQVPNLNSVQYVFQNKAV
jgi:hypothetical protein